MKLASRRWWCLTPVGFVTCSLAHLARANSFQIPGAIYAQRRSVRTLVFWSLTL
jgi:hypothetical protein